MVKKRLLTCMVLVMTLANVAQTFALTRVAKSCFQSDIQLEINSSISGDTIQVPSGECTWTQGLIIPNDKKIVIKGAGKDFTLITSNSTGSLVDLQRSGSRLTGFTFMFVSTNYVAGINVYGNDWRVDNCNFINQTSYNVMAIGPRGTSTYPGPTGLIDNCTFSNCRIVVMGDASLMANSLWAEPLDLGTEKAVYIEDCEFTRTIFGNSIDANYGGSYVFRYNVVIDSTTEAHSVQGTHRATRKWEIYKNEFKQVNQNMWTPFFQRGGTGVIFDNTISGAWSQPAITLDNVRSCYDKGDGGICNGGSSWDGNQPLETGGTGSHIGASGSSVLSDASKSWGENGLVGIYVYNLTDGSKGQITANTSTTVSAILSGGTRNSWNNGDQYKITNGYPCRDQIGRATDQFLWTSTSPYPPQQHEPVYAWNNKYGANNIPIIQHSCELSKSHIQPGRDYFNNAEKPGYTPYRYPHPLRESWGDSSVTAPQNLRIQ